MIALPYGLLDGCIVHVDKVKTGISSGCVCPNCGAPLISKNAGSVRQHHFSHASGWTSCGEGWLHATAKLLLAERFERSIDDGLSVSMRYECDECSCRHEGNLVKGVDLVQVEKAFSDAGIRTDIFLGGSFPKLVEVVVTHEPEVAVYDYASSENIPLVILKVAEVGDLDNLRDGVLTVEVCQDPECLCEREAREKRIEWADCDWRWCQQCGQVVKDMRGQFGGYGDHHHCVSCGVLMENSKYPKHYCCHMTDRLRLRLCSRRLEDFTHGHCKRCGDITRMRRDKEGFFDLCYRCHSTTHLSETRTSSYHVNLSV